MDLVIGYDPEADVLTLKVREGALADEELLDNDVIIGYDDKGAIVSIEVLDASKKGLLNAFLELAKTQKESLRLLLSKIR